MIDRAAPLVSMPGSRRLASLSRRAPSVAALGAVLAGTVNLASALTPNIVWREALLSRLGPVSASPTLVALAVPASIWLVAVGSYLWRRRQRALYVALFLLIAVGLVDLLKGLDVEEALISWVVAAFLAANWRAFPVKSQPVLSPSRVWLLPALAVVPVFALLSEAWFTTQGRPDVERFVFQGIVIGGNAGGIPLLAAGLVFQSALIGALAHSLFRARVPRSRGPRERAAAAEVIRAHGTDTLAAFKLRNDLDYFFGTEGAAFAGFRAQGGVLLLAGDPVGPPTALPGLVRELLRFADLHDLRFGVVGASRELACICRDERLHALYIGDEAIVDTRSFSLEGRAIRKVRQAVHRLERSAYSTECVRARELDGETAASVERISHVWLGGAPERGFSMALDALTGDQAGETVLVIARDEKGDPRAFLQFVPTYGRAAMSLSAMRRDDRTPNGLTEYLVVRAIDLLRELGVEEVSLNFAAFGRLLRAPSSLPERLLRSLVRLGDRFFQIESLYRFNAKFQPRWEPRYLIYDRRLALPRIGVATLRAEGQLPRMRPAGAAR